MKSYVRKLALFAGGVLFGTAGLKILGSRDAKNVYANTTAAVLRAKDVIMNTVTKVQEGAGDILADAKDINEKRACEAAEVIEDTADTACGCADAAEGAEEAKAD